MATGTTNPFSATGSVTLSVTTSPASVRLAGGGDTIVVTNSAASLVFVRFGSDSSVAASASDMPVLPASQSILSVNALIQYASAVSSSGSGSVIFTRGDGSVV